MKWIIAAMSFCIPVATVTGVRDVRAQSMFDYAKTCKPFLTVQKRSCTVQHFYKCNSGEDEIVLTQTHSTQIGAGFEKTTPDYDFIDYQAADKTFRMVRIEGKHTPFSLRELLQTGRSNYSAPITMSWPDQSIAATQSLSVKFANRIETIDEIRFQVGTAVHSTINASGAIIFKEEWLLFYNQDIGYPITGTLPQQLENGTVFLGTLPVELILPNEPGFLSPQAKFDCKKVQ